MERDQEIEARVDMPSKSAMERFGPFDYFTKFSAAGPVLCRKGITARKEEEDEEVVVDIPSLTAKFGYADVGMLRVRLGWVRFLKAQQSHYYDITRRPVMGGLLHTRSIRKAASSTLPSSATPSETLYALVLLSGAERFSHQHQEHDGSMLVLCRARVGRLAAFLYHPSERSGATVVCVELEPTHTKHASSTCVRGARFVVLCQCVDHQGRITRAHQLRLQNGNRFVS
jgi:hypothetical protein